MSLFLIIHHTTCKNKKISESTNKQITKGTFIFNNEQSATDNCSSTKSSNIKKKQMDKIN